MNQIITRAIILRRTDYGEADRILTLLTPDHGKLVLIAKGVRRVKSKLAGGIELFSISDISFIRGRGEVGTLVSTRLLKHFSGIVTNIERTMLGYDLIARLHKVTEDDTEPEYFELLLDSFEALDDSTIDPLLIRTWFDMQILRLGGHTPNLQSDIKGVKLTADARYDFSFEDMSFFAPPEREPGAGTGKFSADHIKFLRIGFSGNEPATIQKVAGLHDLLADVAPLVQNMVRTQLRV